MFACARPCRPLQRLPSLPTAHAPPLAPIPAPAPNPQPPSTIQSSGVSVIAAAEPAKQRPPIPLEIMPAGEFEPLYRWGAPGGLRG
jgi:hypothetical protein